MMGSLRSDIDVNLREFTVFKARKRNAMIRKIEYSAVLLVLRRLDSLIMILCGKNR
jgi:hypothetical protein